MHSPLTCSRLAVLGLPSTPFTPLLPCVGLTHLPTVSPNPLELHTDGFVVILWHVKSPALLQLVPLILMWSFGLHLSGTPSVGHYKKRLVSNFRSIFYCVFFFFFCCGLQVPLFPLRKSSEASSLMTCIKDRPFLGFQPKKQYWIGPYILRPLFLVINLFVLFSSMHCIFCLGLCY
jgi:hypothetical protein